MQHVGMVRRATVLRARRLVRPAQPRTTREVALSRMRGGLPAAARVRRNHSFGECWLKQSAEPAVPMVNMRGGYTPRYRKRHPTAPLMVQWTSGVVKLRAGRRVTNGTWSSRAPW